MRVASFLPTPFVAHLHPWEAKTKAGKKKRRPRNPSLNRNPAAGARVSYQPAAEIGRQSNAPSGAPPDAERPSRQVGPFLYRRSRIGQPIADFVLPFLVCPRTSRRFRTESVSLKRVFSQGVSPCNGSVPRRFSPSPFLQLPHAASNSRRQLPAPCRRPAQSARYRPGSGGRRSSRHGPHRRPPMA